jgi:hypothetical protein
MSARKITKVITLPDGDVMTIRKVSALHLQRANEAQMFAAADTMERMAKVRDRVRQAMGGDGQSDAPKPDDKPLGAPAEEAVIDPMVPYDAHTLVLKGMVSVEGEEFATAEDRQSYVDDLSTDDLEFASREILRLTAPKLFLTDDEKAAEQKNA